MKTRVPVALRTGSMTVSMVREEPDVASIGTAIIAHGAGAGMDHPFIVGFARALRGAGITTVRFNFPAMEAGRRIVGPVSHGVATWHAVREAVEADGPVWLMGKSYGGRVASLAVAEGAKADALVYLGYPLHAPGRPDRARGAHLSEISVPQLFVSGTRDPFVDPHEQFEAAVAAAPAGRIAWVTGATHAFEVAGRKCEADAIGAGLAPIVAGFVQDVREISRAE